MSTPIDRNLAAMCRHSYVDALVQPRMPENPEPRLEGVYLCRLDPGTGWQRECPITVVMQNGERLRCRHYRAWPYPHEMLRPNELPPVKVIGKDGGQCQI